MSGKQNRQHRPIPRCFNPFGLASSHCKSAKDIRKFPTVHLWKFENASEQSFLCTKCRKAVAKFIPELNNPEKEEPASRASFSLVEAKSPEFLCSTQPSVEPQSQEYIPSTEGSELSTGDSIDVILGVSPVKKKRLSHGQYAAVKLNQIENAVRNKFEADFGLIPETEKDRLIREHGQMVSRIKGQISRETSRPTIVKLPNVLPPEWNISKIQKEIGVSNFLARKCRQDSAEDGPSCSRKPGNTSLDNDIQTLVTNFYEDNDNSRTLAGMKDCVTIRNSDSSKTTKQKKLVLCNLNQLYAQFKEKYPDVQIKFSKFATLRPQHCVLAGSSGTHSVCVCTIHQNVKLMLEGCRFSKLFNRWDNQAEGPPDYKSLLRSIMCVNPTDDCYDCKCDSCPGTAGIVAAFEEAFHQNEIQEVDYKQWTTVDHCTIISVTCSANEFIPNLCKELKKLLRHDFISKIQNTSYRQIKNSFEPGQFLITLDFAENYTFTVQEAAQGFHWNNKQASVFPVVAYYKENNMIKHLSFIGVPDCLKHDTVSVYMFQTELIKYLKTKSARVDKIFYFSDGASQQFKNKKAFANLAYHEADFGVKAEWHFFATAHGKGPCDGLGGTVKRLAKRASLQMGSRQHILDAQDLFEWARRSLPNIHFVFCSASEYDKCHTLLNERFLKAATVKGTQSFHYVAPGTSQMTLLCKSYSDSAQFREIKIFRYVSKKNFI